MESGQFSFSYDGRVRKKRVRRPDFTKEELLAMLCAQEKVKTILYGPKLTPSVLSTQMRRQAWIGVLKAVNHVSQVKRSVQDIRKKWSDWCSGLKRRYIRQLNEADKPQTDHGVTGSSKPQPITPIERRVLDVMGITGSETGSKKSNQDNFDAMNDDLRDDPVFAVIDSDIDAMQGNYEDVPSTKVESVLQSLDQELATTAATISGDAISLTSSTSTQDSQHQDNVIAFSITAPSSSPHDPNGPPAAASSSTVENDMSSYNEGKLPGPDSGLRIPKRVVRNSDVILAVKRKKLRLMEQHIQLERDRLEVERERMGVEKDILQVLKDLCKSS